MTTSKLPTRSATSQRAENVRASSDSFSAQATQLAPQSEAEMLADMITLHNQLTSERFDCEHRLSDLSRQIDELQMNIDDSISRLKASAHPGTRWAAPVAATAVNSNQYR